MISDRDIFAAAKLMIQRYGEDAALEAAKRGDELLEEGNAIGSAVWGKIEGDRGADAEGPRTWRGCALAE